MDLSLNQSVVYVRTAACDDFVKQYWYKHYRKVSI